MNAPAPRRTHRLRLVAIVLGAVVALIALAWVALTVLFPPARVRQLVQQQLSRTLARDVRFADAGLGLFPPVRLTVKSLVMSEAGGFGNGIAFQAKAVQLDLDVMALLSRRIVVKRLALDEPGLHLVLRADGTTNFDGLLKPAPPSQAASKAAAKPMDFTVDEVALRRARLLVDDVKAGARRTLVIDSKVALASQAGGKRFTTSGTTQLSDFAFGKLTTARLADLNTSLAKLTLGIEHRGVFDTERKRLALERLNLGLGRARLALAGVVDEPGPAARFDLTAKGEHLELGELLGALAQADARALHGLSGTGRVDFDLRLLGALGPQASKSVSGRLTLANASFRYPGAPVGVEALNLVAHFAPDSLGIGDLTARVQGQPVRGWLSVMHFDDPLVSFQLQGNVDLAAVAPLVAPKDLKLAGRAALDLKGRGRAKDPGTLALGGTAVLSQVSLESPQVPKKIEGVNGRLTFSADRARIEGLTAKAGTSSFTLDGTVTRPLALLAKPGAASPASVDFTFRSPRLDLAELLPPQSGPPVVLNATGGGKVAIVRLLNQKLDVANVRADVALEPGIVDAPRFSMNAYGGAVGGRAHLDLRDPANPGVTIKASIDSLSADQLLSTWTPAKGLLQGSFTSALDFSVAGGTPEQMKKTLTAIGLAEMARGQLGPGPVLAEIAKVVKVPALDRLRFDQAKLPFHVEQGRVVSDPVVLRGPAGEWKIAGAVGLDGALDYAVSATLPQSVTQALSARSALAAGALTDAHGNLLLDLRVSGTAKSPHVVWDAAAMKDRVAGKVSQALADQQQKLEQQLEQAARDKQQAAMDSARRVGERVKQAASDSLKRRAGDLLRGFFGTAASDTTKRP